ncbi:hypothetical protein FACS189483_01590 [Spirochaetia bacterium]|nr:hypothetical protein FACS189483_01590 [Spirochaetia bacterium]
MTLKKTTALLCCLAAITAAAAALPQRDTAAGNSVAVSPLRVGIMPDVNSLPLMIARDEGFFAEQGVTVELVIFQNSQERDAAIQAGQLDGAVSDLLAAAFLTAGGFDMKVTSCTDGRFGVVGSARLNINTLADLRAKRVGLSTNTIIQYIVDTHLESAGVARTEYEPVSVPRMPLRLEMIRTGQIEAAGLPEPLLTAAVEQGGVLLSTTDGSAVLGTAGRGTTVPIDAGVLLFSKKTLDSRLSDVQRFYRAYTRAADRINANPDAYRDYLVEKAAFPAAVKNAYRFVIYRKPTLPAAAQIERVLVWLKTRRLLDAVLTPADLVDSRAIAEWSR